MTVWTCERCSMAVRFAPGHAVPAALPPSLIETEDGVRCVSCRRSEVARAALIAAVAAGDDRPDSTIEREALVAFEIARDPSRSALEIGRAIGASAAAVGVARRKLRAAQTAEEGIE